MPCAFCEQTRRMLARVLRRPRRVPQPAPVPPRDVLVLECCDVRHDAHLIEGSPLVPATYNLGTFELNIVAARRDGWERRAQGWICGVCAARRR
jgi:hypothetical protein